MKKDYKVLLTLIGSKKSDEILKTIESIIKAKKRQPKEELKFKFIKKATGSKNVFDFVIPTKEDLVKNINEVILESEDEEIFSKKFNSPLSEDEMALLQMACSKINVSSTFKYVF